jgi:hypothetical protein
VDLWNEAADAVSKIDASQLTVDQRLRLAQAKALLAIGHELTLIREQGDTKAWSRPGPEA